jgi:hypothetical protein
MTMMFPPSYSFTLLCGQVFSHLRISTPVFSPLMSFTHLTRSNFLSPDSPLPPSKLNYLCFRIESTAGVHVFNVRERSFLW